ncbi:DinB family protein [Gimesia fumaroli]|uniref:DinB family protein n=1 Tax=Gimesia fumaroli TaxID=2527976 RepID=A0A518I4M0_9PLAN|nr:DinB family protein [Gimesia fumaroli]QDV48061.1 DinB family protein [Gimesia fumaroli]
MDLLDRLLAHDAWTTRQLLEICATLPDEQLDHEFDIGHRTLRATLHHIIGNMEIWSALMAGEPIERSSNQTIAEMRERLSAAAARLKTIGTQVQQTNGWDDVWIDHLDDPPREKTFGTALAHIVTHSMHHRAQVLYMLRLSGVESLPEGDVFSWVNN